MKFNLFLLNLFLALTTFVMITVILQQFEVTKIQNIPKTFKRIFDRIIWGAKYIVKINGIWVVARGHEKKNGDLIVIFEPLKDNIIGFEERVLTIKNTFDWIKVPVSWCESQIEFRVVLENINSLKDKHPSNKNFEERDLISTEMRRLLTSQLYQSNSFNDFDE